MPEQNFAPIQANWPARDRQSGASQRKGAQILAFVNQKGGTGKTTTAQNLALCFGLLHKQRVLCVDLDPQGNLGQGLMSDQVSITKTADRLLVVPKVNIDEYIIPVRPGIDLIHNNFQKELREAVDRLPLYPGLLRKQLGAALEKYDYVIVDTPAGLCRSTQVGIDAADQVILVVSCGIYGLKGMVAVMDWMSGICGRLKKPLPSIRIVLNNYDERRRFDREFKEQIQYIFGDALFQTMIRTSTRVVEAAARGMSVIELDPFCSSAIDFKRLSREALCLPPDAEPVAETISDYEIQQQEGMPVPDYQRDLDVMAMSIAWAERQTIDAQRYREMDGGHSLSGRHALVVEDHQECAELLKMILEDEGCEVRCAGTGIAALQVFTPGVAVQASNFNPDLVLLDLRLPDMSGVDFVEELRRRQTRIPPIVMLSAEMPRSLDEAARRAGVIGIRKPFDFIALFSAIAEA